jgi:hypothetical protein
MALPVPVKTWLISPNNTLPSNVGPTDSAGRTRDLADFWGTVVDQLLALSSGTISVVASSDGINNISPPTIPSANYWTAGSANMRQGMFQYFESGGWLSLWVILQIGPSQLSFCFYRDLQQFVAYWSPSGAFVAPSTNTSRPVAGDEILLTFSPSVGYFRNYGIFNKDNQGIINQTNNYLNYTQQVQVGLASDLSGFYAVSFRSQVACEVLWFGTLQNAVWTTPPYNWSTAKVMFHSGNLTYRQYAGYYGQGTGQGWQPRSTLDSNGVYLLAPAIPANGFDVGSSGTCYGDVPNNSIVYNGTVDLDTNAYPLSNVSVYSPSRYGLKGVLTDLWFGPANGSTYTFPSSAPLAPNFFQANEFVFPWDGATPILFA